MRDVWIDRKMINGGGGDKKVLLGIYFRDLELHAIDMWNST